MNNIKNKSQEEVEQSYKECSYKESELTENLNVLYATGNFTMILNGADITQVACTDHFPKYGSADYNGTPQTPVEVIKRCPYNDSGWCYYDGKGNSNDNNGACNNAGTCEVNNAK